MSDVHTPTLAVDNILLPIEQEDGFSAQIPNSGSNGANGLDHSEQTQPENLVETDGKILDDTHKEVNDDDIEKVGTNVETKIALIESDQQGENFKEKEVLESGTQESSLKSNSQEIEVNEKKNKDIQDPKVVDLNVEESQVNHIDQIKTTDELNVIDENSETISKVESVPEVVEPASESKSSPAPKEENGLEKPSAKKIEGTKPKSSLEKPAAGKTLVKKSPIPATSKLPAKTAPTKTTKSVTTTKPTGAPLKKPPTNGVTPTKAGPTPLTRPSKSTTTTASSIKTLSTPVRKSISTKAVSSDNLTGVRPRPTATSTTSTRTSSTKPTTTSVTKPTPAARTTSTKSSATTTSRTTPGTTSRPPVATRKPAGAESAVKKPVNGEAKIIAPARSPLKSASGIIAPMRTSAPSAEVAKLKDTVKELEEKCSALTKSLEHKQSHYATAQETIKQLTAQIEEVKGQANSLAESKHDLEKEKAELAANAQDTEEIERLQKQLEEQQAKIEELEKLSEQRQKDAELSRDQYQEQVQKLQEELDEIRQSLAKSQADADEASEALKALATESADKLRETEISYKDKLAGFEKLAQDNSAADQKHQEEIQAIKETHTSEVELLKESIKSSAASYAEEAEKKLKEERQEWETKEVQLGATVEDLKNQLLKAQEGAGDAQVAQDNLDQIKKEYTDTIIQLQDGKKLIETQLQDEKKLLENQFQDEKKSLETQFQDEKKLIETQFENAQKDNESALIKLQEELEETKKNFNDCIARLKVAQKNQQDVQSAQAQIVKVEAKNKELENQVFGLKGSQEQLSHLATENQGLKDAVNMATNELSSSKSTIQDLKTNEIKLVQSIQSLEQVNKQTQEDLITINMRLNESMKSGEDFKESNNVLLLKVQQLQEKIQGLM